MNYFIVGATGYIGSALISSLSSNTSLVSGSSSQMGSFEHLDLLNPSGFNFNQFTDSTYVIFTAAISSPDICNKEPEYANKINVTNTQYFINKALEKGARCIFLSSDTVFGQSEPPCYEETPLNPCEPYAEMKAKVEDYFSSEPDVKAVRLSYVLSKKDKFSCHVVDCHNKSQTLEVFHPLNRSIVYLGDVMTGLNQLCTNWDSFSNNEINFSGPELLSRLELTKIYKKHVFHQLRYKVVDPPAGFFDSRPHTINMKSHYFQGLLNEGITEISTAINKEFYNE